MTQLDMKNWTTTEKKEWRRLHKDEKMTPQQRKARVIRQDMMTWTAEEKKEWRKLQRKEYYLRNKDKIQQKAKERRAEKNRKQRYAKYPLVVATPPVNAELMKKAIDRSLRRTTTVNTSRTNPYNQFVKTNFNMIKYDNPSFKFGQIMKKLGEMWSRQKKRLMNL
jgi:hypothetical protein